MMTHSEIFEGTVEVITTCLASTTASITLESSLRDDLAADSLDSAEIIMTLEEKFDMSIPEESARGLKTVGDLVALIEKVLADKRGVPANGSGDDEQKIAVYQDRASSLAAEGSN